MTLGCTVEELLYRKRISSLEVTEWAAFLRIRADRMKPKR